MRSLYWRNAWPAQRACINRQYWLSLCKNFFQSSERILRSKVLSNYRIYSVWLEAISAPVIYWSRQSRIDNILVLDMDIYYPYGLVVVFQTCLIGFNHSALIASKKLGSWLYTRVINWVLRLKLPRLINEVNILLWIYLILRFMEITMYLPWLHGKYYNCNPWNNCC